MKMVSKTPQTQVPPLKTQVSKELRAKANDFLNSRLNANNLVDIIGHLEQSLKLKQPLTPAILTLEVVFAELLKRREFNTGPNDGSAEREYHVWLLQRYTETLELLYSTMECDKIADAGQAMTSCMKLLVAEYKYPLQKTLEKKQRFPFERLKSVLKVLLSQDKSQIALIQRFKEYAEYVDVVCIAWRILQDSLQTDLLKIEIFTLNCLEMMNVLNVTKGLHDDKKLLCPCLKKTNNDSYEYTSVRRTINNVWVKIMEASEGLTETVHRQLLVILLERVLNHLEKPVLLTDFLMDSLDCGGPISLLALQGIFTLIQKHNITYPNIYEKLYSMFEPEIFHTKYKARLFYLADIFLSSTHLPESLVAAFAKRLARLSLIAPPQDAIIIVYFIGNIILRHTGLRRLISAQTPVEVSADPFIMDEPEPTKSKALESSLWEIVALQKHAIPSVSIAAKFITQPLPKTEWDLSTVLEQKETDIFEQEVTTKKQKLCALAYERPTGLAMPSNDKVTKYWKLF